MAATLPTAPTASQAALARATIAKSKAGKPLTQRDERAIAKVAAWNLHTKGLTFSAAVPRTIFMQWTGRTRKVLLDWADRYGFPFRGETIDQKAAWMAVCSLIADHGNVLQSRGEDPLLAGASQALRDEYVRQQIREKTSKAGMAELDFLQQQGRTIYLPFRGSAFHFL